MRAPLWLALVVPAACGIAVLDLLYAVSGQQLTDDLAAARSSTAAPPVGRTGELNPQLDAALRARILADRLARLALALTAALTAAGLLAWRLRMDRSTSARDAAASVATSPPAELLSLQRELSAARRQLAELQRQQQAREDHWAHAHHELRTPLIAVAELAGSLLHTALDPDQQQHLIQIRQSARSLLDLVSDTLDWERLQLGKLTLRDQPFAPAQVLEDTIATLSTLAYAKGLELVAIIDHDVPSTVGGDGQRWQQIVTNLLSNAIKFTDKGEVELRLSATTVDARAGLLLVVRDTGPGIPAERLDSLFKPYERVEDNMAQATAGSGLGLSIVQRLTTLMGGQINVSSAPGIGTHFNVAIPFRIDDSSPPVQWHGLRGAAIAAVEPNATALRALRHQLAFWGIEFSGASSIEALAQMLVNGESHHDALLISPAHQLQPDDRMKQVLQLASEQHRPTIIRLNSVDTRIHEQWRLAGATQVLPKCASRLELFRTLLELLAPDQSAPGASLAQQRILVVENNPANARVMETLLQRLGAAPQTAATLEQARQAIRHQVPDAVLLDNQLDDGSGTAFTTELLHEHPDLTVVGMSAWLSPEQELKWRDAGVSSVLLKPFDPERLARALGAGSGVDITIPAALIHDAEIAPVITEELPLQFQELDRAFVAGDLERLRGAAHQLHGSAAFFHLEPLNQQLSDLERSLGETRSLSAVSGIREDIDRIRRTVSATVAGMSGDTPRL